MSEEIKRPSPDKDQAAFRICCASKRGEYVNPDDIKFVHSLYKKFPEWAKEIQVRVFNATKPFGAS